MAINDVLPLKAARRDAIAKLESFGAPEHNVQFLLELGKHFCELSPNVVYHKEEDYLPHCGLLLQIAYLP